MKKEKRRPQTQKALMRRFTALILGTWLLTMWLLTYAVAKDFLHQIYNQAEGYIRMNYGFSSSNQDPSLDGIQEKILIQATGGHCYHMRADQLFPFVKPHTPSTYGNDDWIWEKWDLMYGYEAAVAYYQWDTDFMLTSGNYLSFTYTPPKRGLQENSQSDAYGYIDLDAWEGCLAATERYITSYPQGDPMMTIMDTIRMTGYFEGNEFIPLTMQFISAFSEITEPLSVWENPDPPADRPPTLSITARDLFGILADYEPVTADSVTYEGLPELLEACIGDRKYFPELNSSIFDAVFIHYGGVDYSANGEDIGHYSAAIAVRCWPMGYAAWRLLPTYLTTLTVAIVLIRLLRRRVRRGLVIPMENAISGSRQWEAGDPWYEPALLKEQLGDTKKALHEAETENRKISTALDYARNAEENRRQLISNITHELKTPLAVIHSYAEGLQSDISAEKKEKYLSVILEETERMDAIVLQMLDLSRLEAGKVRLSTDRVCLLQLTEAVMEKFAPLIEAKGLTVNYEMAKDFAFTADEARITQAVTNLVSNAVKYATPGGRIRLWIYDGAGSARFEIANTAPPLPPEAIEKVFDSFYRADPSRSEPGTGLGLAIVKSIAELHRGSCTVRNTSYQQETFVEFVLNLPLS